MCGGTRRWPCGSKVRRGLSPRVRGNRNSAGVPGTHRGSIPACAGEPRWTEMVIGLSRVYPRVCGGTLLNPHNRSGRPGLSPRVRGNLPETTHFSPLRRSIPACAGEPAAAWSSALTAAVYPRVCGGTRPGRAAASPPAGLSPRVRGNLVRMAMNKALDRSIPACAGEPSPASSKPHRRQVYPRVCGGTGRATRAFTPGAGLSPRVRGNPPYLLNTPDGQRSIPACAGEPSHPSGGSGVCPVYPRVCGGTAASVAKGTGICGLSPRVRGNRDAVPLPQVALRSIPACAGEPRRGL